MVNYFSEWLLNRFREGYALSRNPFYHDVVNSVCSCIAVPKKRL
jgi:hypothetical protein